MNVHPAPPAGGALMLLSDAAAAAEATTAASASAAAAAGAARAVGASALLEEGAPASKASPRPPTARPPRSARTRSAPAAGYASGAKKAPAKKKTSTASKATPKAADPLAFLSDKSLSVDEKLFRFLKYVSQRYDDALEAKMKELAGKAGAKTATQASATATTKKKKGGILGKIGGALKKAFPIAGIGIELLQNKNVASLLKQVSGPVLAAGATAFGMPQLAPVLLKAGPELAGAATALAKELDAPEEKAGSGAAARAPAAKTPATASSAAAASGGLPELTPTQLSELQRLQEKQREMFALLSNILKSGHDMRMSVIGNLRA